MTKRLEAEFNRERFERGVQFSLKGHALDTYFWRLHGDSPSPYCQGRIAGNKQYQLIQLLKRDTDA